MKALITIAIVAYIAGSIAWFMKRMGESKVNPHMDPIWKIAVDWTLWPPVGILATIMGALTYIDDKINKRLRK